MKFKITSTPGSLSGGQTLGEISTIVETDSEKAARRLFEEDERTRVYGRRIIKIENLADDQLTRR